jgi:hypothetical protein
MGHYNVYSSLVYSKTSELKINYWCACVIIDLKKYIYIFVYYTWVSELLTNCLFIFFSFGIFGKPMYIEIIGLQEWIEKSWC